jgi:hypothetical protein
MSAAFAAKFDSKDDVEISVDTAKGPRTSTKATTANVEFDGGGGLEDATFRIVDGLKHDIVLGTSFKAEATTTISFSTSTISFANQGATASFRFKPTDSRHWRKPAQLKATRTTVIKPGKALIAVRGERNKNIYSSNHGLIHDAIASVDSNPENTDGLQFYTCLRVYLTIQDG